MTREIAHFKYGREMIPTSLAESSTCRLLVLTDDQIEVLRNLVNYAHNRRSWNDETIDSERYYMPSDDDWDDIEALVDDLENELMTMATELTEPLTINMSTGGGALPAEPYAGNTLLHLGQADSVVPQILMDAWNSVPVILARCAKGTKAAPTALTAGITLLLLEGTGWHSGGAYAADARAAIGLYAAESWTSTAQGTYQRFYTTPIGATLWQERMRISDAGKVGVGVSSFTAGGAKLEVADGITFPATQVPSSNPNTLDDYQWGTAVVAFVPGTSGTITLEAASDTLAYTKIGRLVCCTGRLAVASVSSPVGELTLTGLPFACANAQEFFAPVEVRGNALAATAITQLTGTLIVNTTTLRIDRFAAGVCTTTMASDVLAGSVFTISFFYFSA